MFGPLNIRITHCEFCPIERFVGPISRGDDLTNNTIGKIVSSAQTVMRFWIDQQRTPISIHLRESQLAAQVISYQVVTRRQAEHGLASVGPEESLYCEPFIECNTACSDNNDRTNITEPVKTFNSSRGYLVSSFLLSNSSHPLQDEVGEIIPQNASFAGFNLLVLAPASRPTEPLRFDARLVTNHGAGGTIVSRPLSDDERVCGGVSNGVDGEGGNDWPKVKHAMQDFSAALKTLFPAVQEAELTDRLFELLAWVSICRQHLSYS